MKKFTIIPGDNFIWNHDDLLRFLVKYQGMDIIISTRSEGCCANSIGLYKALDFFDFKSVTIDTANVVEKHAFYNISINQRSGFRFFSISNVDYSQYHTWNFRYIFGALYNRANWHRIGLASFLHQLHLSKTQLNFRYDPYNEDQRQEFELQRLFEIDPASMKRFANAIDYFPKQIEIEDGYTPGASTKQHTDQLVKFYQDFLIDIVAETFTSGQTFYPTEKTVRPMLLKKPMIVMGSKDFLVYLRQMGFKTFYKFWDEDYDGYEGRDRYLKILKLIDDLAQLSTSQLHNMYNNMQSVLDHNYNLLVNQQYSKNIQFIND